MKIMNKIFDYFIFSSKNLVFIENQRVLFSISKIKQNLLFMDNLLFFTISLLYFLN